MPAEVIRPGRKLLPFTLRLSTASVLMGLLLLVVLVLTVWPVGSVMMGAFRTAAPGYENIGWTLKGFAETYARPDVREALWTSLWLAAVRTLLAVGLSVFLAWIIARTDTPGRRFLEYALWLNFFLPFATLGYVMLASQRSGLFNIWLQKLPFIDGPLFNIYSAGGIIWVSVLTWSTFLTLFMLPAFRAMDASLEESSRMSGATGLGTLRRITMPLMQPAILAVAALAFVRMVESFETEALLGTPAKVYVFTTKIYEYIMIFSPPYHSRASALAFALLILTFTVVVLQWRMLGQRRYTTVTGRGYRAAPMSLGRWKYATLAFFVLYFLFSGVLPMVMVGVASFMRIPGVWKAEMFGLEAWRTVLAVDFFPTMIKNTFLMSLGAATAGMALYTLIAYVVTRTSYLGRKVMDLAAWLPWAVPGIVLGLGFLWAIMSNPWTTALYQSLWVLILVNITRGFPVGTRLMSSNITQVSGELEECSRVHGASWTTTFARIWLPLLRGGFITGWVFQFAVTFRFLDAVILLYGAKTRVLPVVYFDWFRQGELHMAAVLAILQAVFLLVIVVLVRRFAPGAGMERTISMR